MYDRTVTLFVEYESATVHQWYPFVLSGVDLNTDRGQMLKKYGADSTDNAELHITYIEADGEKYIRDSSGDSFQWLKKKNWKKQTNDNLSKTISFGAGDFFWEGEWKGGIINDDDYSDRRYDGFYAYMNDTNDDVYLISSVSGAYTVIPHFEIMGK